jgi:hypothetical protein
VDVKSHLFTHYFHCIFIAGLKNAALDTSFLLFATEKTDFCDLTGQNVTDLLYASCNLLR